MIAYKLLKDRADSTVGPLFINRRQRIPVGVWLPAEDHPTKGYAHRPGWHCTIKPYAPHLSRKGRTWYEVEITNYVAHRRPESQGGLWYLAQNMKLLKAVTAGK